MSLGNRIAAELRGDRAIWMVAILLSLVSLLAVYSTAGSLAWQSKGGNTTSYLIAHAIKLGFGLFIIYLVHMVHYRRFQQFAPIMLLATVAMLALTLVFGKNVNQATRWVDIMGVSIQTSEIAKIGLITYIAKELTRKQENIRSFKEAFVPIIVPVVVVCGLIAPADLSTAVILFVACLLLMFIGRVSPRFIFLTLLFGVITFAFLLLLAQYGVETIRADTWRSRLMDYLQNDDGNFQIQQAKIAIANGGFFGNGPGSSIMRNFLPYAYADFIYAIICEEYGMLGGLFVLSLYVFLMLRVVKLAVISPKAFGVFLAIGLGLLLTIQALTNIAVNVHLLPATGQTLPMISMGGTSLILTCVALGMILSVSKNMEQLQS